MTEKMNKDTSLKQIKERVSSAGAKRKKAIITIEAAFAVPMFLLAAVCLIWLMEMQSIKISLINASHNAAKSAAEDTAAVPVLNTIKLKSDIINLIGKERINRSLLEGGTSGISCGASYLSPATGEMHINIRYKIRLPIPMFGEPAASMEEGFKLSGWTGFIEKQNSGYDSRIVYITDHGSVYHEDYGCSYLQLSVRFVSSNELQEMRNAGGAKYYPCSKCVYGSAMTGVYVTEEGRRYHNSLNCSGLKRTIHAVERSEVEGMGGCSRCSG